MAFDVRLQDDRSGDTLLFNSFTGEYRYTRCAGGPVMTGRGRGSRSGCMFTLTDPSRVAATFEHCAQARMKRGQASIRLTPFGPECLVIDSNPAAKTGACR